MIDNFGSMVFDDSVMKERLPAEVYASLQRTIKDGRHLNPDTADVVASAMKDWALEKGATHYTHWFQPLTGVTAEKHDSFIVPAGNGKILMEFSGKELIFGETDGSAFPSGGLRATFEARGYTAWDATSYAFIKDGTLCIPTAFCSFGGASLDKKTPLLRSMERLNAATLRILRLFGNDKVTSTRTMVGAEQEYFLLDREKCEKRPDLVFAGRTLFGARAPKGQELEDHYSGAIKPRVKSFMSDLDEELWKLGILAKTEHNEAAPSQHELAPFFTTTNIATDHNQLIMEMMQKVARRHDMVCLLTEKPFAGVNGSGKHNNWSIFTDTGANLFEPGETPYENAQFLLFVVAVVKAADEYPELFRFSVATAGNDHRLGANEAPPAVFSVFLGDELTAIFDALEKETPYGAKEKEVMRVGVHTLPKFPKDSNDRNRTSPFAFTGNKFEFRMPGSSASLADCNTVLNSTVAHELNLFADRLEKANDFESELHKLIVETVRDHRRIIFNGNSYDEAWLAEAEKRGLPNLRTTPDALPHFLDEKSVSLFTELGVFSREEMAARYEVMTEHYGKLIHIEAATMTDMTQGAILPAVTRYTRELSETVAAKEKIGIPAGYEKTLAARLADLAESIAEKNELLAAAARDAREESDATARALAYKDNVLPAMNALRAVVDEAETLVAKDLWPYPSYGDLLFSIR